MLVRCRPVREAVRHAGAMPAHASDYRFNGKKLEEFLRNSENINGAVGRRWQWPDRPIGRATDWLPRLFWQKMD